MFQYVNINPREASAYGSPTATDRNILLHQGGGGSAAGVTGHGHGHGHGGIVGVIGAPMYGSNGNGGGDYPISMSGGVGGVSSSGAVGYGSNTYQPPNVVYGATTGGAGNVGNLGNVSHDGVMGGNGLGNGGGSGVNGSSSSNNNMGNHKNNNNSNNNVSDASVLLGQSQLRSAAESNTELVELDEAQRLMVETLSFRVKVLFGLHLVPIVLLLNTTYWYTTVVGLIILAGLLIFAWTHRQKKSQFVFLYTILVGLNFIKDVVIIFFFFFAPITKLEAFEYVMFFLLLADAAVIAPLSLYNCLWLYRSFSVTILTF